MENSGSGLKMLPDLFTIGISNSVENQILQHFPRIKLRTSPLTGKKPKWKVF